MRLNISNRIELAECGFSYNPNYDDMPQGYFIWLNNSRILSIKHNGEAIQYTVKQVGRRDCFNVVCTEAKFLKTKIVKDLIRKGILVDDEK